MVYLETLCGALGGKIRKMGGRGGGDGINREIGKKIGGGGAWWEMNDFMLWKLRLLLHIQWW